ncbi:hypothetical protein [Pedobacter agri]|uniref:hypothetical protein n=1 Tax=Pedobacter agri TaxID=454586 RepID=UPI0029314DC5|nr:hypothetical protein [Pedobacter agri]
MAANLLRDQEFSNEYRVNLRAIEENDFEQAHRPLLDEFVTIIDQSKQIMLDDLNGRHPNSITHLSKPVRVNENVRGALFLSYPDQMHVVNKNTFAYINDGYAFVFKKLTKKGKPSGILTPTLRRQLSQGVFDFPGFKVKKKVYIGYVIQNSWEEVSDIYAVTIEDFAIDWKIDLRQNYKGGAGRVADLFSPDPIAPDDSEIVIRIKNPKKPA